MIDMVNFDDVMVVKMRYSFARNMGIQYIAHVLYQVMPNLVSRNTSITGVTVIS